MTRLLSAFIILVATFVTSATYAEYYVVYSGSPCGYASCYERPYRASHHKHKYKRHVQKHKVHKHRYVHKRYYYEDCYVAPYYAWVPVSTNGCGYYVPGGCGCDGGCGRHREWRPAKRNYSKDVSFMTPQDNAYYYPYDPDLSTGDDDATVYPGMDIDN